MGRWHGILSGRDGCFFVREQCVFFFSDQKPDTWTSDQHFKLCREINWRWSSLVKKSRLLRSVWHILCGLSGCFSIPGLSQRELLLNNITTWYFPWELHMEHIQKWGIFSSQTALLQRQQQIFLCFPVAQFLRSSSDKYLCERRHFSRLVRFPKEVDLWISLTGNALPEKLDKSCLWSEIGRRRIDHCVGWSIVRCRLPRWARFGAMRR